MWLWRIAAEQIQEKGLGVVVGVMGHGYACRGVVFAVENRAEPFISKLAASHLHGSTWPGGTIFGHIEIDLLQPDAYRGAKRFAEGLVAVALLAAQMEIAVGGIDAQRGYGRAGPQEGGAVGSAAESHCHR